MRSGGPRSSMWLVVRFDTHAPSRTAAVGLIAVAALTLTVAACNGSGGGKADKVAGSGGPRVLRLAVSDSADQPESSLARYFARQAASLSGGKLRVHVVFEAAGVTAPDVEVRTVALVRDGRYELGWIGARAWDQLGVTSFRALQAPFLISNYALLDEVVKSALARQMLGGLKDQHVVGLALIPGLLRHPVGIRRPIVSLPDFAGTRIRDQPSATSDAVLQALGATPVHVGNSSVGQEVSRGRVDGVEASLANAPVDAIVAANVTLFPKTLTLFAGDRALAGLDPSEQRTVKEAARRTLLYAATYPVRQALAFDGVLARRYCKGPGRIVLATGLQLDELERAARPVYAMLSRDPETRAYIARIRRLRASLPPPTPVVVPKSCLTARAASKPPDGSPSILNGTYHRLLTASAARAVGAAAGPPEQYPLVITAVLRDGTWIENSNDPPGRGSYTVAATRVTFDLGGNITSFTYTRDADGTLRLRPILPMDRGRSVGWPVAPWRLVGPPTPSLP